MKRFPTRSSIEATTRINYTCHGTIFTIWSPDASLSSTEGPEGDTQFCLFLIESPQRKCAFSREIYLDLFSPFKDKTKSIKWMVNKEIFLTSSIFVDEYLMSNSEPELQAERVRWTLRSC